MGTRALIKINDVSGSDSTTLVCIYKQYDGYLSGLGATLHEFLSRKVMVNGYSPSADPTTTANGVGDLAAQLIHELKQTNPLGGIYLYRTDTTDAGQDFTYTLNFAPDKNGIDALQSIVVDSLDGSTHLAGVGILSVLQSMIDTEGE